MTYSIQHILTIIEGQLLNQNIFDTTIERLLIDSRQLIFPTSSLFFAFKSNRQDGHQFIPELYKQGVRNFIITAPLKNLVFPNANFILVENTVNALQKLVAFHRRQFAFPIIGITGSNGKTIVKEWLFQLLNPDFKIARNPGSYNSQIGVPLSVWQLDTTQNLGIFEAGISQPKEMKKIAKVIHPTIGLFTNIGAAHSEGFRSQKQKIKEKIKLFKQVDTLIYGIDNKIVDKIITSSKLQANLFTWSARKKADLQIINIQKNRNKTIFTALYKEQSFSFDIPFIDAAAIENAIHCCATMLLLGVSFEHIQKRMPLLEVVSMRLELKKGINNCTIINDSYNADLTSLELALSFATKRTDNQSLTLFLSDILQSGLSAQILYERIAKLIMAKKVNQLYAIGQEIEVIKNYLPSHFKVAFFKDTAAFLKEFSPQSFQKETILLKGARVFQFENIVNRFEEKVHKTVLEVDLNAIAHNLKVYGKYLKANTKLIAMVKASAYGSGAVEVAKILEFYKVDYLAVAYADEGIELRKAGIQLPIIVLNPEVASFVALVQYNLEPEIYSLDLLTQLITFLPNNERIEIHLKLDTGMHRLGFEQGQLTDLLTLLKNNPSILVKTIFSHLAASDRSMHDDFTETQVAHFLEMYEELCYHLSYRPARHILNSSGILRFSQYQFEMVRLGIGLYGIDGSEIVQKQLKIVNTLKATISQIKQVDNQDTVGYNRSGKISQTKKIATINIGYADGLARKAGNGRYAVSVQGRKAPIIGNVCMDMCMIDVTAIPEVKIGDEVFIFGEYPTVVDLANCLETIPYEVFTSVSNRVKRIYFRS
ncbi:MAG: bifunctional UDP-N-acetylmuramoyl-tripeptide:D-alanyl-D-alanine ligase/alanine racemase [Saprospiraceae bacterium]